MDNDKIREAIREAEAIQNIIQQLDLKPTILNLNILTGTHASMKFIKDTLEGALKDGDADAE